MLRTALAALILLSLPITALAQPGARYTDRLGDQLLFADVDIPVFDQAGHLLVDPATQRPVSAYYCLIVSNHQEPTDVTAPVSSSHRILLQGIHYTLDLPNRQIIIRHVWVLNTIQIPESPGYRVIPSPRVVEYDLDDYRAPLLDTRPSDSQCQPTWDQLLANLTVTPNGGGSGGGGGFMSCQWRYDSYVHKSMHLECPDGTWRGHITR